MHKSTAVSGKMLYAMRWISVAVVHAASLQVHRIRYISSPRLRIRSCISRQRHCRHHSTSILSIPISKRTSCLFGKRRTHNLIKPSQDAVITLDYRADEHNRACLEQTTYRFMRKPFVRNDYLRVRFHPRLDTPRLPVPEHNIAFTITTAYPLAIG